MNFKHVSRKARNLFILISFHAAMTQFLTAAPPVAVNDTFSLQEDQPLSVPPPFAALLANDSDPDGDSLTVFSVGAAVNGSLSLVGGNLNFTPNANFVGTASFNYSIHDGHGETATATAFITYTPVDDPLANVLVGDLNASEDTTKQLSLRVNDVDAGSAAFSLRLTVSNGVLNVSGGTATISGNGTTNVLLLGTLAQINSTLASTVNYLPPTNFFGSVPFTMFTAELDAQDHPVISDTDQFVINVASVNDLPIARHDHFSVAKNQPLSLPSPYQALLANDTDVDGDSLTVFSVGSAVNGSLSLAGGNLIFTPSPEFVGIASYNYSIHDGHSGVGNATARIFVGQPVTLTAHPNQTPGNYRFYLNGPTGVPYQILTSADLVQWTLWTNVVNTVTNQLIIDNTVPGSARRFYRVQAGP